MLDETVCPYHPNKLILGYCYRCKRPVCQLCGMKVDEKYLLDEKFPMSRYKIVKESLKTASIRTNLYLCKECLNLKPRFSIYNLVYTISGVSVFLIGLFFELLFLAFIGAIVLIVGLYNLLST